MPAVDEGGNSLLDGIFAMLVSAPLRRFTLPNKSCGACLLLAAQGSFSRQAAKKYLFDFSVVLVQQN